MRRTLLALAAIAAMAGVARAGYIEARRGTGSWGTTVGEGHEAEFDVWTWELFFGGWYVEIVWGWWSCR